MKGKRLYMQRKYLFLKYSSPILFSGVINKIHGYILLSSHKMKHLILLLLLLLFSLVLQPSADYSLLVHEVS
jgi:hypothetical protein